MRPELFPNTPELLFSFLLVLTLLPQTLHLRRPHRPHPHPEIFPAKLERASAMTLPAMARSSVRAPPTMAHWSAGVPPTITSSSARAPPMMAYSTAIPGSLSPKPHYNRVP